MLGPFPACMKVWPAVWAECKHNRAAWENVADWRTLFLFSFFFCLMHSNGCSVMLCCAVRHASYHSLYLYLHSSPPFGYESGNAHGTADCTLQLSEILLYCYSFWLTSSGLIKHVCRVRGFKKWNNAQAQKGTVSQVFQSFERSLHNVCQSNCCSENPSNCFHSSSGC